MDKKQKPKRPIRSAPVALKQAVERMKNEVDQVEVIRNLSNFKAVEQFYQEFHVASDYEIRKS